MATVARTVRVELGELFGDTVILVVGPVGGASTLGVEGVEGLSSKEVEGNARREREGKKASRVEIELPERTMRRKKEKDQYHHSSPIE